MAMGNTLGDVNKGFSGSRDLVRAAELTGQLTDKKTAMSDLAAFKHWTDLAAKISVARLRGR